MNSEILSRLGLVASIVCSAGEVVSADLASLEERYRDSLVQVRYTQHVTVSTAEPAQEDELITTGLVVSSDGVVMVSAIIVAFNKHIAVPLKEHFDLTPNVDVKTLHGFGFGALRAQGYVKFLFPGYPKLRQSNCRLST